MFCSQLYSMIQLFFTQTANFKCKVEGQKFTTFFWNSDRIGPLRLYLHFSAFYNRLVALKLMILCGNQIDSNRFEKIQIGLNRLKYNTEIIFFKKSIQIIAPAKMQSHSWKEPHPIQNVIQPLSIMDLETINTQLEYNPTLANFGIFR